MNIIQFNYSVQRSVDYLEFPAHDFSQDTFPRNVLICWRHKPNAIHHHHTEEKEDISNTLQLTPRQYTEKYLCR